MTPPARRGKHYEDREIALVYLIARSQKSQEVLADLLERSEDAVDMIWRWIEGASFPPEAGNKIKRQVKRVEKIMGVSRRGSIDLDH